MKEPLDKLKRLQPLALPRSLDALVHERALKLLAARRSAAPQPDAPESSRPRRVRRGLVFWALRTAEK